jgi:hypothetical protein
MKTRHYALALSALALAAASFAANAAIVFQNLGTNAPPANDWRPRASRRSTSAPQAALPDYLRTVTVPIIPGSPLPGKLVVNPLSYKVSRRELGNGWCREARKRLGARLHRAGVLCPGEDPSS